MVVLIIIAIVVIVLFLGWIYSYILKNVLKNKGAKLEHILKNKGAKLKPHTQKVN